MRYSSCLFAATLGLALCAGDMVSAQTSSPAPTKRELQRQDSEECAKQVPRLYVEPFAECIFKRQAARKAAAKPSPKANPGKVAAVFHPELRKSKGLEGNTVRRSGAPA